MQNIKNIGMETKGKPFSQLSLLLQEHAFSFTRFPISSGFSLPLLFLYPPTRLLSCLSFSGATSTYFVPPWSPSSNPQTQINKNFLSPNTSFILSLNYWFIATILSIAIHATHMKVFCFPEPKVAISRVNCTITWHGFKTSPWIIARSVIATWLIVLTQVVHSATKGEAVPKTISNFHPRRQKWLLTETLSFSTTKFNDANSPFAAEGNF